MRRLLALVVLTLGASAAPASAQDCLRADLPAVTAPERALRFGIFPLEAGSVGAGQQAVAPQDPERAVAAVTRLQPSGRRLVARLNRMFQSDGRRGIDRFAAIARRYDAAGFDVELQVRYHPSPEDEGDMERWAAYVREAATTLGAIPGVVALSITNEANLNTTRNTSDGAYRGVRDAILRGIPEARSALDAIGRRDVELGFSYAFRSAPDSDDALFEELGARGSDRFRAAVDFVGLQAYPGLFWPPVIRPGETAGSELLEGLVLLRSCYLPKARLGPEVDIAVTENGYATNLGHSAARQAAEVSETIAAVHRFSGTLGVSDYRYFNLRDNDSDGADLFAAVGVLDDAYREKPAFSALRDAVARYGRAAGARTCDRALRLPRTREGERWRRARAVVDGVRVPVRLGRRRAVVELRTRVGHAVRISVRSSRGRLARVSRSAVRCA